ncbi:Immunity protein 49 [Catalinimonas alkaloidigena]|uniref:Immunity protein 49 n=1 Tax=Catalinimonas alkaloidigena TaxID=1075417 RepID=A0A1G9GK21_9BACT|nr:Imm49 family immunity protein [Catalinimonas alkaloidigena]SDL00986.1 Immunity protein 49 [Catalinimonas alkaloidigena]
MIKRHKIDRNPLNEFNSALPKFNKFTSLVTSKLKEGKSGGLWWFKDIALRLSIYSILSDQNDYIKSSLSTFVESGTSYLKQLYSKEDRIKIFISDIEYSVESINNDRPISPNDLFELISISLIIENEDTFNELLELIPTVRNESKDPFWNRSLDLLLMCFQKKDFEQTILDDINSILNSNLVAFHSLEGTKLIQSKEASEIKRIKFLPIIELWYFALSKDEVSFNETLEQYLINKSEWIIKNSEKDNSSYWVDFLALGVCSYANKKGITISVISEYIPKHLYE